MADYVARITRESGIPVVLLAGGAASSHGFFPGLVDALTGHRVVELDRPGTGRAQTLGGRATLATGSRAAAALLTELGAGPAVVVGQSLGGALAIQFATDHPELVAGLVLIDPTPVDLPGMIGPVRRIFAVLGLPGRLPVVGPRLERLVWTALGGRSKYDPGAEEAWQVMATSATLAQTAHAIETFEEESRALAARLRPLDAPVVLLTAERKHGHKIRASHDRLVSLIGGRVAAPAGAVHAEQLRDPRAVNELVLSVLAEASARAAS